MCWFLSTIGLTQWAAAQEGAPEEGVPELVVPEMLEPELPLTYADGWWWTSTGPRAVDDLTDVAIHPLRDDIWVVIQGNGGTWVTYDAGQTWIDVLPPLEQALSRDEALLREVEARIGELTDDIDVPDEDEFVDEEELAELEDSLAAVQDAAQDAASQLQSEVEGDRWFLDDGQVELGARPRVWFTTSGLLVVGRSDGLRLSVDLGASWFTLFEEPVTAFAELPDRGWVAGTPTGAFSSPNLTDWTPIRALEGVEVRDLVSDAGMYVASDEGLWFSEDLQSWAQLEVWQDEVWTTRPLIEAEPPLWLGGPRRLVLGARDTLWYGDDPAASPARPTQGGPVRAAREIVRRDIAMIMAASASGPFESTDGGFTWVRIDRGLDASDCRGIDVRGEIVLLATGNGLHRLRPLPPNFDREAPELEPWVPLGTLVDASLGRSELNQRLGSRWVAAMMPQVALTYQLRDDHEVHWDADTWTTRDVQGYWVATVQLTWRPNRQQTGTAFDVQQDSLTVFVVDDDIVIDDGTSPAVMYSQVARGMTAYRDDLAETIGRLFMSRQRLVLERALLLDETLIQQVDRELRIAELEARLDVLTDGAVSAWDPGGSPDPVP